MIASASEVYPVFSWLLYACIVALPVSQRLESPIARGLLLDFLTSNKSTKYKKEMNLKEKVFNLENSLKGLQESYNTLLKQKEVLMQLSNEAIMREYKLQEKNKELEQTVLSLKTSLFDVSLELYLEETKTEG